MKEECLAGGWDYVNGKGFNRMENWSDDGRRRHLAGSLRGACKGGATSRDNGTGVHGLSREERVVNAAKGRIAIKEKYGVDNIFSILNKDVELNAKKKLIFKEIGHQQGEKNSNYGNMWITDGASNKRINKYEPIMDGWRKGRVMEVKINLTGG